MNEILVEAIRGVVDLAFHTGVVVCAAVVLTALLVVIHQFVIRPSLRDGIAMSHNLATASANIVTASQASNDTAKVQAHTTTLLESMVRRLERRLDGEPVREGKSR